MITGLTHIAIRVTDLEQSLHFYSKQLGFPEVFRLNDNNGNPHLVYLKVADNQFIELFPGADGSYKQRTCAGLVHICLQVDDIQKTYQELTTRGIVTRGEPVYAADNSWQFWTSDPDGNQIEFHQFTPESRQVTG